MSNFKNSKGEWIGSFQVGDIVLIEDHPWLGKILGKVTTCFGWRPAFDGYAYVVNILNNDLTMKPDCYGHYSEFDLKPYRSYSIVNKFTVIRFFRPFTDINVAYDQEEDREVVLYSVSNLGGISFFFDVEHHDDAPTVVKYSFAQCHATDNFNKKHGAASAEARYLSGDVVIMDNYNEEISLIENVWHDLAAKAARKDTFFLSAKLYHVRNAMRKILNTHLAVVELGEELDDIWG